MEGRELLDRVVENKHLKETMRKLCLSDAASCTGESLPELDRKQGTG